MLFDQMEVCGLHRPKHIEAAQPTASAERIIDAHIRSARAQSGTYPLNNLQGSTGL